jgi:hypothetical protein
MKIDSRGVIIYKSRVETSKWEILTQIKSKEHAIPK